MEALRESQDSTPISVKEARQRLKIAEGKANSILDRGYDSGFLRQKLGMGIYHIGFLRPLASKIAPKEIAVIKLQEERDRFRLAQALREAYDTQVSEPFPNGIIKSRPVEIVTENFIPLDTPVAVSPKPIEADDNHKEHTVPESPETEEDKIHWSEWDVFRDPKLEETQETSNEPIVLFDEEKRKVNLLKGSLELIPQTNSSLVQFIDQEAKKVTKDGYIQTREDLRNVVSYIIEHPIGNHTEFLKGATSVIDYKTHR